MILDRPLTTPRLTLRNLTAEDAAGPYLRWMNDPRVTRYLESRFQAHDSDDLRDFIAKQNSHPDTLLVGIVRREDGRHIGNLKIGPIDRHHRLGDMGLIIGEPDAWGQGFAREAIAAVASLGFGVLGLHKITAGCYGANEGSRRAFLAAGFVEEGARRRHYLSEGRWDDCILMARWADDGAGRLTGAGRA